MKIMVFRDGKQGEAVTLPGEHPLSEIGELLGGEVKEPLARLTPRLALCVRAGSGGAGDYLVRKNIWQRPELLKGPCAVVRMDLNGHVWDMTAGDMAQAGEMVAPAEAGVGA